MAYNKNDSRYNASGYYDDTAYRAIKSVDRRRDNEEKTVNKILATIYNICELAGYRVESRIVLKNVKSGKEWR